MRRFLGVGICFCLALEAGPLDRFQNNETFKRAHVGIYVIDRETKEEVYKLHEEQFFASASLQKIPLSMAAAALLGNGYVFETDLEYEGEIDSEGVLHGNVWVRGGGDPALPLSILSEWENKLRSLGIKKIAGSICIDVSCFETILASPTWNFEDLGNYYGAGASGLSINQNMYTVTFQPGKEEGDKAVVLRREPEIPHLTVYNEVTTGPVGSGDNVYVFGSEYSPIQFYRGTVPKGVSEFTIRAAIPDSAAFVGHSLEKAFSPTLGVQLIREKNEDMLKKTLVMKHLSEPLGEVFQAMNPLSINIYAEHLLKAMGRGSAKEGLSKMGTFLKGLGIPFQIKDGAGLARMNLFTPKGYVTLLSLIREEPVYRAVYDSITEMGKGRSPESFPKIEKGVFRAKTGSMSNTYNAGGYFQTTSGKEYIVAIFCNYYAGPLREVKEEIAEFLNALAEKDPGPP